MHSICISTPHATVHSNNVSVYFLVPHPRCQHSAVFPHRTLGRRAVSAALDSKARERKASQPSCVDPVNQRILPIRPSVINHASPGTSQRPISTYSLRTDANMELRRLDRMIRGEIILIHQILLRQLISPQIAKATKQRPERDVELTVRKAATFVRIQSIDSSTDSETGIDLT